MLVQGGVGHAARRVAGALQGGKAEAAGRPFSYLAYWSEREDRGARNAELEDVNASWGPSRLPSPWASTPYGHPPAPLMFLYGSRRGATVRDNVATIARAAPQ